MEPSINANPLGRLVTAKLSVYFTLVLGLSFDLGVVGYLISFYLCVVHPHRRKKERENPRTLWQLVQLPPRKLGQAKTHFLLSTASAKGNCAFLKKSLIKPSKSPWFSA